MFHVSCQNYYYNAGGYNSVPYNAIDVVATEDNTDEMMTYRNDTGIQGICPPGWHIPMETEWSSLVDFYEGNGQAAILMKIDGIQGFNAKLKGNLYSNDDWHFNCFGTFFWSSTSLDTWRSLARGMNTPDPSVSWYSSLRSNGFSVRCLYDHLY